METEDYTEIVLLPAQWQESRHPLTTGVGRLLAAVLMRAIDDVRGARITRQGHITVEAVAAWSWIEPGAQKDALSFLDICHYLGQDPVAIRARLYPRWRIVSAWAAYARYEIERQRTARILAALAKETQPVASDSLRHRVIPMMNLAVFSTLLQQLVKQGIVVVCSSTPHRRIQSARYALPTSQEGYHVG